MSIANRAFVGAKIFIHAAFAGMDAMRQKIAVNTTLLKAGVGDPGSFHHFASNGTENHRGGPGNRKVKRAAAKAKGRLRNRLAHRG